MQTTLRQHLAKLQRSRLGCGYIRSNELIWLGACSANAEAVGCTSAISSDAA
jgi:hypothetical protein